MLFETPPGRRRDTSHLRLSGLLPARGRVNGNSTKSGAVMVDIPQPLELSRVFLVEIFGAGTGERSRVRPDRVTY